jgi:predicted DNA-binding transcriptional regulator YafY
MWHPAPVDTATRLLQLLALLHARPFWTADELASRLEVTPRTVRRDVARLRALEHPIETVRGRHGGYQFAPGGRLPPLILDDREALAVVLGLRLATSGAAVGLEEAAVGALAKLERVLPTTLRERLQDLREATMTLPAGPGVATDADHLVTLAQACRRHERVRFPYRARDGAPSYRHVEPARLVHHHGRWYLLAFDLDRADWRTFRVDRASSPLPTGVRSAPREVPDPEAMIRAATLVEPYPVTATLRLAVDHGEALRLGLQRWLVLEADGSTTVARAGAADAEELARWLAVLPCRFEVLEPPEVREALHERARSLLDASAS